MSSPGDSASEVGSTFRPEYFRPDRLWVDLDRANQYRLGILGYEMLVGGENSGNWPADGRTHRSIPAVQARPGSTTRGLPKRGPQAGAPGRRKSPRRITQGTSVPPATPDPKPSPPPGRGYVNMTVHIDVQPPERCPRRHDSSIDPNDRYGSLAEAVEAISHRRIHVEIARDSFTRILNKDSQTATEFFRTFYSGLLGPDKGIRGIFDRVGFPPIEMYSEGECTEGRHTWPKQFNVLKEAIVLLFAYNYFRETRDLTVLSRISRETHGRLGIHEEYYDHFKSILVQTVVQFDPGNYSSRLTSAWQKAIEPGLNYLKGCLRSASSGSNPEQLAGGSPPSGPKNGGKPGPKAR